jgi:hypothetical protein
MPMDFGTEPFAAADPVGTSVASSRTRFMNASKPRRTPVTVRFLFSWRLSFLSMYLEVREDVRPWYIYIYIRGEGQVGPTF